MAAVALHASQRFQRLTAKVNKFLRSEIAEFAGYLARIQKQTYVGWRNSGCHNPWFFLHVVGDEPIVFVSAELGKVPPGADCGATQKHFVFIRGFSVRKPRWPVQPYRHKFAA